MRPAGAKSSDMRMPTFAHTCPVSGFQFFLRAGRFNPHDIIATRAVSGQTCGCFMLMLPERMPIITSAPPPGSSSVPSVSGIEETDGVKIKVKIFCASSPEFVGEIRFREFAKLVI